MENFSPTIRQKRYGWIPDLPDHRDKFYLELQKAIVPGKLPPSIDLRPKCSPIENQENLGSCTANALVGNLEYLKMQQLQKVMDFSRLFVYYNERVITNSVNEDSGAALRDGIKTLARLGDCPENECQYIIENFTKKPSSKAYQDALNYQILSYYRINSLHEMKHTLSTLYPFVFGFSVYESFESPEIAKTGIVPMPNKDERLIGGHAVMAVGYDENKQVFIVRNSWGASWGDKGYCYFPYDYLANASLSSDTWTIRSME
jgi:C1A family cysteine protease